MEEKKTDRRTLKTRKAIYNVLMELLLQKELHKVTVQEISDLADINRTTFYKHFLDIYDVYEKLTKIILSDVAGMLTQRGENTPSAFYHDMLNYVSEHAVYFTMIFSPYNTSGLYQNLLNMFIGIEGLVLSEQLGSDYPEHILTFVVRYHVNGCFAVIADWLTSGFERSQDYIVQMLSDLDKSIWAYLRSQHS